MQKTLRKIEVQVLPRASMFWNFKATMDKFDPNHTMTRRSDGSVILNTRVNFDEISGFTSVSRASLISAEAINVNDMISFYRECSMDRDDITLLKVHQNAPASYVDLIVNDEAGAVDVLETGLSSPGIIGDISLWEDQSKLGRGLWRIREHRGNDILYLQYFNNILVFGSH